MSKSQRAGRKASTGEATPVREQGAAAGAEQAGSKPSSKPSSVRCAASKKVSAAAKRSEAGGEGEGGGRGGSGRLTAEVVSGRSGDEEGGGAADARAAGPSEAPAEWWGARFGFVRGGALGSMAREEEREGGEGSERKGFLEDDQEKLYNLVQVRGRERRGEGGGGGGREQRK